MVKQKFHLVIIYLHLCSTSDKHPLIVLKYVQPSEVFNSNLTEASLHTCYVCFILLEKPNCSLAPIN